MARTAKTRPAALGDRWATTRAVAKAAGVPTWHARRLLEQLRIGGAVQRTERTNGDGDPVELWRLVPPGQRGESGRREAIV